MLYSYLVGDRTQGQTHLAYVFGLRANGVKLPSVGLWLNASKTNPG